MDLETSGALARLGGEMAGLAVHFDVRTAELRAEMRQMRGELLRHFDVLFESVRDDIRLVAEAVAMLSMKLDSLRP